MLGRALQVRNLWHINSVNNKLALIITIFAGTSYEPPLTNVFTMQWFLTLFSTCLPRETVLRVWFWQFRDWTSSCNESDLKGHSKVQAASEISRMIWWKNMLCFLTILFYCRYGIWSYSRATRCSSELHWPSGRAWKSEFIPVQINRKILLIFLSNIKKHPGCDQRGRVLQRHGAALQGDARVEQQGLQQTHQGEFHLEAIWASIAKAIIKWLVVALLI